jgi:hypothetical protein
MAHHHALYLDVPREVVREKTYYGERLLRHGPLAYGEFREITGWQPEVCEAVLDHMRRTRMAERINGRWSLRGGLVQ